MSRTTEKKLVSVIIPVYNVEKYLEECVQSVLHQTYPNIEIILVDDESPDKCPELCDRFANEHEAVTVIHKKNGGLSDARNAGIEVARGDCFAFIDSDDYIAPNMLEVMLDRMERDGSDMSICCFTMVNEISGEPKKTVGEQSDRVIDPSGFWHIYKNNGSYSVSSCNKIFRRELFDNLRYSLGRLHEDEFIIHRIVDKCEKISLVSKPMYFRRYRQGSIMTSRTAKREWDCMDAMFDRYGYFMGNNEYDLAFDAVKCIMYRVGLVCADSKKHLIDADKEGLQQRRIKCVGLINEVTKHCRVSSTDKLKIFLFKRNLGAFWCCSRLLSKLWQLKKKIRKG